jgi:hypothetical protein
MRLLRILIVAVVFLCPTYSAFCCSCSFGPPVKKTSEESENSGVYSRVVQPLGKIYFGTGQLSDMVRVMHERHWGLPWNWPR